MMATAEQDKRGRGRPKGTGIDDRIWLREMTRLMRIDPATTPTGAIKALGITDPSTIRRLRDKHREQIVEQGEGGPEIPVQGHEQSPSHAV